MKCDHSNNIFINTYYDYDEKKWHQVCYCGAERTAVNWTSWNEWKGTDWQLKQEKTEDDQSN